MGELVPVVDLAAPGAAAALDRACREVGFLSIVNHGVARPIIDDMLAATDAFFARPLEEKLRYRAPRAEVNRGYAAKGTEGLVYSLGVVGAPPDLFEAFNIGPEDDPNQDANIWPEQPGLKAAMVRYFEAVRALAHRLTAVCATALGLPTDFFETRTDHSTDTMRVNHYERSAGEPQ